VIIIEEKEVLTNLFTLFDFNDESKNKFLFVFFLKREQIFLSNDKKKKKGFGFHVGMILEDLKR
jgi:hypothetical protein